MTGLLWIAIYACVVFIVVFTFRCQKATQLVCGTTGLITKNKKTPTHYFALIIIYALLFALVNLICTRTSIAFGSDRENYLHEFGGNRETSVGLEFVFYLFRITSNNFEHVLLFTTFICTLIILFTHKFFENNSKVSLVFLLTTDFVFFTFTSLKQSYACALSAVFFLLLTRRKTFARNIVCILLIVLASLFHSSSVILIPIFIICNLKKITKTTLLIYVLLLLLLFVFFNNIGAFLSALVKPFSSGLSALLSKYFVNLDYSDETSFVAFLKGTPFYLLFGLGCFYRDRIKNKCKDYDMYLILLSTASMLYLCSIYIYWTMRFRAFFYLPAAIFLSVICKNVSLPEKQIISFSVIGLNAILLVRWIYLVFSNYGGF